MISDVPVHKNENGVYVYDFQPAVAPSVETLLRCQVPDIEHDKQTAASNSGMQALCIWLHS